MEMEVRVERWSSDDNRAEVHYFQRILGHDGYLGGFNPILVNEAKWRVFMEEELGVKLKITRK